MPPEQKAKPPPPPSLSRLAADALVETIDGPVEIVKLVGKIMPVLTRFRDGQLGFRMMREIREIEAEADLVELVNGDEQRVRLGVEHVLVREDGAEIRAGDVQPGDALAPSWSYPPGYVPPDASEYSPDVRGREWQQPVVVSAVEPIGRGPVFGSTVNETKCYFLTFGAMSRAQK